MEEATARAGPQSWSDIPQDLAGLVLRLLPAYADRARFAAVCPQWRAASRQLPLPPPLPLLALAFPDGTFYSLPYGKPFRFPGFGCAGYRGAACGRWLVFPRDNGFFLVDPFTGATLTLPALPHIRLQDGNGSGLDALFINKFEEQRKDYWETLYSSVNVGPILILCSADDQLAPYSVVENFAKRLLELGGDVNLVKWHSSPHVGHYKYHPEEYRTAVTELLMKASALYASRRQLNGYEVGTSEHSDIPPSISDRHRTSASSNNRLRQAPIDPTDQFFLPGSMEYHESSEGLKPELFNMPSMESLSLHGVLGQVMYDVCVPKNVEGWDLKPSASRHVHTVARRHGSFNPMKCVRRSRL